MHNPYTTIYILHAYFSHTHNYETNNFLETSLRHITYHVPTAKVFNLNLKKKKFPWEII